MSGSQLPPSFPELMGVCPVPLPIPGGFRRRAGDYLAGAMKAQLTRLVGFGCCLGGSVCSGVWGPPVWAMLASTDHTD